MKALTLIQPWAGLIATGVKRVENRTWAPPELLIGQRFAIHAGSKLDRATVDDLLEDGLERHELWEVRGAVLGVATLDRWVADHVTNGSRSPQSLTRDEMRFYNGPIAFVLRDVVALSESVPCKGALGFWTLSADVERSVTKQIETPR